MVNSTKLPRYMASRKSGLSRDTSIIAVELETGEFYIIASLSTRKDTQVIYIDPTTGALSYKGSIGHDLFLSEQEAFQYVTDGSRLLCKRKTHARAIIGYQALGSLGLLFVATKLIPTIPRFPGGGCIYTVAESQCIRIQLQNSQLQGKGELKNILDLADNDIDGKYYFCETRDITRPFPSQERLQNPDDEFVWNEWFSKPFKDIGLPQHCVVLLQGFAEYRTFGGSGQQDWLVSLVARRSRLHPGTRYLARGLNSCFSTGNEVECEQLVWLDQRSGQNVHFSSYIWRRGTIPIWWGADLKLTSAEAEIYVSSQDPYQGSAQYYQRLSRRYNTKNMNIIPPNQKKSLYVPILCVNLLRKGEGKSESILVEHFEESISYIRSRKSLPDTQIHLINYDWHTSVKLKGEQQTVEELWRKLKNPTVSIGFCEGSYFPSKETLQKYKGGVILNDDIEGGFFLRSLQNGVIRYNCADSLDRTNAASFFGALQVFVEQCTRLGINLDKDAFGFSQGSNSESNTVGDSAGPLPRGWEEKFDGVTGKSFYINHNTRTTTWVHPCSDKPWKRFSMSFDQFKNSTILYPTTQLSDLFLLAGDIHATLYTGSKAMHSQILSIFNNDGGKFKQLSMAQNMKITVQRRIQNHLIDGSRQKQLEMFLGIRLFKYLPSVSIHPLHVVSRSCACFLKPITNMFPGVNGEPNLLSFRRKDNIWVCTPAADVLEFFIYLAEPCHVCQLLLRVAHGAEDSTFPGRVDVRTGSNLDGLKLVVEGACIPQCSNGTNLVIPLAGAVSPEDQAVTGTGTRLHADKSLNSLLYDFEELEGELNFLTRVVALTFYPTVRGSTPITIGEFEVLGVSLPWRGIFTNKGAGSQFVENVGKLPRESDMSLPGVDANNSKNPFLSDVPDPFTSVSNHTKTVSGLDEQGSVNSAFDLLSCDFSIEQSKSPSFPLDVLESSHASKDVLDFFDDYVNDHSSEEISKDTAGVDHYLKCLRSFSDKEYKLSFTEAVKLEVERLHFKVSAAERDRALMLVGIDPASLDPNCLISYADTAELCKLANNLALFGQTTFENKIIASIGLENVDNDDIDFWNVSRFSDTCYAGKCEVRAEKKSSSEVSSCTGSEKSLFVTCCYCERTSCKNCCAGKGAILLLNYISKENRTTFNLSGLSGSNHGGQSEGSLINAGGVICKACCNDVILHALYVDYIRVLSSSRRRARADSAAKKALDEVLGSKVAVTCDFQQDIQTGMKQLAKLLNRDDSLAEFPSASLLHSVETDVGSEPALSLLSPYGSGAWQSYWKAPPGCSKVELSIILGSLSDVSGVIMLVSSCGYSVGDCPIVEIWASNKINREERSCIGTWDVNSLVSSIPEICGLERTISRPDIARHVRFAFRNPVRCRIIWIMLTLPPSNLNSLNNIETGYSLLSLDDISFSQPKKHESFSGEVGINRCIHAKRFIVYGKAIKKELDGPLQGSDKINIKAWLDRTPQYNRFRVVPEAERLRNNDLILEQLLPFGIPPLAGFRLDALNVIKPRVTHSPSSNDIDILQSSLTCLEDRHIFPAVLYLHVSIIQESRKSVTLGEYRLPEVRAGTALYFDFPRAVQARIVVFKLFGDIGAFADDPNEQGDAARDSVLVSGLSLSNRIKLYYYSDPNEPGKLV